MDTLPDSYEYPEEQHEFVPKLSSILDTDVPENFYIDDEKARKIIDQALKRLESLGSCHATITPDRVDKRQNGRRAKPDEESMFTLTAQDLHGVILDPVVHIVEEGKGPDTAILRKGRTEYGKAIRKDYEAGRIKEQRKNMTEYEVRPDEISNTLTTVLKDNLLLEAQEREREPQPSGIPKILQVAHKGSGGQKGWIHSTEGIVGAVTATDYKDPKYILEER